MKKKSILLLLLGASLIVPLIGCGSTVTKVSTEVITEDVAEETQPITYSIEQDDNEGSESDDDYKIDTMLPDRGDPVISLEELEEMGYTVDYEEEEFDKNLIFRTKELDYESNLEHYIIIDGDMRFDLPMDFSSATNWSGWEFGTYDDMENLLDIQPGTSYSGYLENGKKKIDLEFINAGFENCAYDECRLKKVYVSGFKWLYDEERVDAVTVDGITFGSSLAAVDSAMEKAGFGSNMGTSSDIRQYYEFGDTEASVGCYIFTMDDDKVGAISVEYVGK